MNHSFVNLLAAIALSVAIIFGWQHFFEKPRLVKLQEQSAVYNQQMGNLKKQSANVEKEMVVDRQQAIVANSRVQIKSELLSGSISLKGLRFDDLTLLKYKQEIAENSPAVELFSPSNSENAYFAEVGWWGKDKSVTYPDSTTNWQTDNAQLVAGSSVNLYWVSPEKVKFKVSISLDENYLFSIKQSVENHSARPISVQFYGLINKTYENK